MISIRFLDSRKESDIEMVANYRHDFHVAFPLLSESQRSWLKNALNVSYPTGHEWLLKL